MYYYHSVLSEYYLVTANIYAKIMNLNMQKSTWREKTSSIFFNYS